MSCKHLNEFVQDAAGIDAYRAVHANMIIAWTTAGLDRKARASVCMFNAGTGAHSTTKSSSTCQARSSARLHACLHCIHVACANSPQNLGSRGHHSQAGGMGLTHRDIHSRDNHHPLSVELGHGNIYCSGE